MELSDGTSQDFFQERDIYSVRAEIVDCPNKVEWPVKGRGPIKVRLVGAATATIDIRGMPKGLPLGVPPEVLTAYERYGVALRDGFDLLKTHFPKHKVLLTKMMDAKLAYIALEILA